MGRKQKAEMRMDVVKKNDDEMPFHPDHDPKKVYNAIQQSMDAHARERARREEAQQVQEINSMRR